MDNSSELYEEDRIEDSILGCISAAEGHLQSAREALNDARGGIAYLRTLRRDRVSNLRRELAAKDNPAGAVSNG